MSKSLAYKIFFLFLFLAPLSTQGAELKHGDKTYIVDVKTSTQANSLSVRNDFNLTQVAMGVLTGKDQKQTGYLFDQTTVAQLEQIATEINREPKSAKLVIESDWAKEFDPGQTGQALDIYQLRQTMTPNSKMDLPVLVSYPQTTLGDTNDLGIKELVAVGESDFTGSSGNRKVNITVGSSKYNGLILKPGEEFSFNKYLGDVDAKNGFKPEIVIKREGLVPEFGGGLCQVSSTAFRAAMNAGFPITARKNHAFAVRYYSPAGTDATIYSPTVDLKFVNDLASHMLVRTRMEGNKLYYEYYGTKDNRQVVLEGPVHYDKRADGSLKAVWTKKVTKNGETVQQDFRSNYVSPNLYQKVATTQASTPNPVATPTPANPTQEPAPAPAPLPAPTPTPST